MCEHLRYIHGYGPGNYGYSVVALCVSNRGISMDTGNYGYSVVALSALCVVYPWIRVTMDTPLLPSLPYV